MRLLHINCTFNKIYLGTLFSIFILLIMPFPIKFLSAEKFRRYVKLRLVVFLGGIIEETRLLPTLVLFWRIQVKTPIPEHNTLPSELQVIITASPLSGCQQLV